MSEEEEKERRRRGGAHGVEASAESSKGQSANSLEFRPSIPKQYRWDPQPDITTFELAQCLPVLVMDDVAIFNRLPDECKRHWKVKP